MSKLNLTFMDVTLLVLFLAGKVCGLATAAFLMGGGRPAGLLAVTCGIMGLVIVGAGVRAHRVLTEAERFVQRFFAWYHEEK